MTLSPRHAISRVVLSPDGRQVATAQPNHGLRVLDVADGAERLLVRDAPPRSLVSPTSRHTLHTDDWGLRLAAFAAGLPAFDFQRGWRRAGRANRPPTDLPGAPIEFVLLVAMPGAGGPVLTVSGCSLTADHRLAVGRYQYNGPMVLYDLATERVAAELRHPDLKAKAGQFRAAFTAAADRVVLVTPQTLFVFDLPAAGTPAAPDTPAGPEPAEPRPSLLRRAAKALFLSAPDPFTLRDAVWPPPRPLPAVLTPAVVAPVTAPQPDGFVPPFAVLPCGTKALLRGTRSRVELRDLTTGGVLTVWKWGLPRLLSLAASADGLTAAAAGERGQLVVWDLE